MKHTLPYTEEDSDRAYRDWQATCGPHSIAAACQVSLDAVRAAIPNYQGWMAPTQIRATLDGLKKGYVLSTRDLPTKTSLNLGPGNYIARIQWEGSWLGQEVPIAVSYRYTHYIAVLGGIAVLDTMRERAELIPAEWWLEMEDDLVGAEVKRSTGWHFTHVWRIKP